MVDKGVEFVFGFEEHFGEVDGVLVEFGGGGNVVDFA